jgi:ParB family chromosome partitioning protein
VTKYRFGDDGPIEDSVLSALTDRAKTPRAATPSGSTAPQSWVGQQAAKHNVGLAQRIEQLEAERRAGHVVLLLDPKRIRATQYRNRLDASLASTDPSLVELRDSIAAQGLLEPIRVRLLEGDADHGYEIIVGHRRHAAAVLLDAATDGGYRIPALLDARAADARELVLQMYTENEFRQDISAYEKGLMFRQWLNTGLFADQKELAATIRATPVIVTKYLQVADLPAAVLAAFTDPRQIRVSWVQELVKAIKEGGERVLKAAAVIGGRAPRPEADAVVRELIQAAQPKSGKKASASREEPVKIDGRVALRLKRQDGRATFKYYRLDAAAQNEITERLLELATALIREKLKGPP